MLVFFCNQNPRTAFTKGMSKEMTLGDVQNYCLENFPAFMKTTDLYGNTHFRTGSHHYSFCRLADFLIEFGFRKNDSKLIQEMADFTVLMLERGDESVRNGVYVSFIEGLVDQGYKYPQLKGFIQQMPEDVRTFIKGFFIDEVLDSLGLERNDKK